jgi:hypothetical protein
MDLEQMRKLEALEKSGQFNRLTEYRDFLKMANWESQKAIFRNMSPVESLKEELEIGAGHNPNAYYSADR